MIAFLKFDGGILINLPELIMFDKHKKIGEIQLRL